MFPGHHGFSCGWERSSYQSACPVSNNNTNLMCVCVRVGVGGVRVRGGVCVWEGCVGGTDFEREGSPNTDDHRLHVMIQTDNKWSQIDLQYDIT